MNIDLPSSTSIKWIDSTTCRLLDYDKACIYVDIFVNGEKCNSLKEASDKIVLVSPVNNTVGIFNPYYTVELKQLKTNENQKEKRKSFSFAEELDLYFYPLEKIKRILNERIRIIREWADKDIEEEIINIECGVIKHKLTIIRGIVKNMPAVYISQIDGPHYIDILLDNEHIHPFDISEILTGHQIGIFPSYGLFDCDKNIPIFLSINKEPLYLTDDGIDYFNDNNLNNIAKSIERRFYKILDLIYENKKEVIIFKIF